MKCWECSSTSETHDHHVVPRSRGGTKTVRLCVKCHSKAHHRKGNMSTSALTSAALRAKVARGEHVGRPRYGWRVEDGELVAIEAEQVVVQKAVDLRAQGLTLRAVSAALADSGMVSRTGRPFGPSQVRSMVAG